MLLFRAFRGHRPSFAFVLLALLVVVLWMAGGASRADVLGQAASRGMAAAMLVLALLFGPRPAVGAATPVVCLLVAAAALVLIQLIPLPHAAWQSLPGRDLFGGAAVAGTPLPWRPLAIVPGAAFNAAQSLIVPFSVLLLMLMLPERERRFVPGFLLAMIVLAALIALLQLSGGGFDNPFINETVGQASGIFANRNHFSLLLAFGLLLAPACAFSGHRVAVWRALLCLGLLLLFTLLVLGTGSRAGLGLGAAAMAMGLVMARDGLGRLARLKHRLPAWAMPAVLGACAVALGAAVIASLAADRAISIDRLFAVDLDDDMRSRGLPVVIAMFGKYFPAGSGFGSFDAVFRIHEPLPLLKLTFFNHAHNDFLELGLEAGLPGLLLLAAAILWWGWATVRVWRAPASPETVTGRLGAAMLLLVMAASSVDYPARTPIMMAIIVIAATWLSWGYSASKRAPLPPRGRHLYAA